jgi:hypothetical protein
MKAGARARTEEKIAGRGSVLPEDAARPSYAFSHRGLYPPCSRPDAGGYLEAMMAQIPVQSAGSVPAARLASSTSVRCSMAFEWDDCMVRKNTLRVS